MIVYIILHNRQSFYLLRAWPNTAYLYDSASRRPSIWLVRWCV